MVSRRALALFALATASGLPCHAATDDRCTAIAEAEQARAIREFGARPPGSDPTAQLQWSRELHAALAEVERRERQCQADARPKPGSAEFQRNLEHAQDCTAQANRRLAAADARFQAGSRDRAAQAAVRAEHDRIIEDRMQCVRQVRR
jgi:hypothetical protein